MSTEHPSEEVRPHLWYRASDLARRWQVHEITIWSWARKGRIPRPTKLGPNTTRWKGQAILDHERARAEQA